MEPRRESALRASASSEATRWMVPSVLVLVGLRERGGARWLGFNGEDTNPGASGCGIDEFEVPSPRSLLFERRRVCGPGMGVWGGDGEEVREWPRWEEEAS